MTAPPPPSADSTAAARILVVDDDAAIRTVVTRVMARHGHAVVAATTAEEALRHLEEREFDLAILDIHLGNGSGIELLEKIKRRAPTIEAVMLSGSNSIAQATQSLRAGAFDFVEKPFHADKLLHTVVRALAHQRLRQTTALYQAVQVIFRTRDLERLPEAIVNVSMEVMGADATTLLLPGLDGKFYVAHAFGLAADVVRTTRIAVGEGVAGRVVRSRMPLVIAGDASQHRSLAGVTARTRVRSSIVYPLVLADEVFGVLTFNRFTDECPYGLADLDKAGVLASQVVLALENTRLTRQNAIVEKLAAVGQLAAGMAHEINTPMQFVGDSLHFLTEAFDDLLGSVARFEDIIKRMATAESLPEAQAVARDAEQLAGEVDFDYLREAVPKALARTQAGASRITKIVQAVKEFGLSDANEKTAVDLKECIADALLLAQTEYEQRADVETEFADTPPVVGHAGEIKQVLIHLIVNAAHAIAEARADSNRRGTIRIRTCLDSESVLVLVEDNGTGIPAAVQARMFDPFFTTKPVGQGTGLGLSIARTLVEKHGGSLTFETQIGQGTRFSIRLPAGRP